MAPTDAWGPASPAHREGTRYGQKGDVPQQVLIAATDSSKYAVVNEGFSNTGFVDEEDKVFSFTIEPDYDAVPATYISHDNVITTQL